MKDKKLYYIIHASCIVTRHSGIKELDTFSFIMQPGTQSLYYMEKELKSSIDLFNEFAVTDVAIVDYENEKFEKVGEIWL
jgi:hypothetical protein